MVGLALLTALHAIETAGELKPDSRLLDLTLVIGYYIEFSHDLPEYGIEGDCVAWRKEAIAYFEQGKLDTSKALASTELRIATLKDDKEPGSVEKTTKADKWSWDAKFKAYKRRQGKVGGNHYDITKMSRAQRAEAAFEKKDPLAAISLKDLKADMLDLA